MIYLSDQKILFIKPMKTASTSVDIAFSCNAKAEDIVTPIAPNDELVRKAQAGRFPCNWAYKAKHELAFKAAIDRFEIDRVTPRSLFGKRRKAYKKSQAKFYNHITPTKLAQRMGDRFVKDAFMVTMSRHPYDLVVSYAYHIGKFTENPDIQKLIAKTLRKSPINDKFLFTRFEPDFVIRFENMAEDLAKLEGKFDLKLNENLPFTKHKSRKDSRRAETILTPAQKELVQAKYRSHFETFGYEA